MVKLQKFMKTKESLDLLDKLLVLNPQKRLSAEAAAEHFYLKTPPYKASILVIVINCFQYKFSVVDINYMIT